MADHSKERLYVAIMYKGLVRVGRLSHDKQRFHWLVKGKKSLPIAPGISRVLRRYVSREALEADVFTYAANPVYKLLRYQAEQFKII